MHITEFLERAAPTPIRPLDMEAVRVEGRRSRWYKRRWIWVTGLIALGGAAVPAGINLAPASSPGTRVTTVRPRPEPGATTPGPNSDLTNSANANTNTDLSVASDATPTGGGGDPAAMPSFGPTPTTLPNQSPPTGNDQCVLQGGEAGVDTPGAGGAGVGNFPECGYTARSAAGYVANGSWQMDVTKPDGTVHSYGPGNNSGLKASTGPTCGNLGIVQPGDQVHVILYTGAENTANVYYVKVGPSYHC